MVEADGEALEDPRDLEGPEEVSAVRGREGSGDRGVHRRVRRCRRPEWVPADPVSDRVQARAAPVSDRVQARVAPVSDRVQAQVAPVSVQVQALSDSDSPQGLSLFLPKKSSLLEDCVGSRYNSNNSQAFHLV